MTDSEALRFLPFTIHESTRTIYEELWVIAVEVIDADWKEVEWWIAKR